MCGIFGSNNKSSFYDLYQLNRSRGSYSHGFYCYRGGTDVVYKTDQELALNDIPDNMEYYLHCVRRSHTQFYVLRIAYSISTF